MAKLSFKIAFPIILSTIFAITIFIAVDYERIQPSFYLVLFFFVIYVFFYGYSTGERFASPVKDLLKRANQISTGNLSDRIYLDTKDELAELAKIYNKLAEELEESCNRERNTEKSVDIKVRAKTQALEETISALEQKVNNRTLELQRLTKELNEIKSRPEKDLPKKASKIIEENNSENEDA
jgi:methyl-accepting chemotaxis protein